MVFAFIQIVNHIKEKIVIMWCQFTCNCRKLTLHLVALKCAIKLSLKTRKKFPFKDKCHEKLILNGSDRQESSLMLSWNWNCIFWYRGDISQPLISSRFRFNLAMMTMRTSCVALRNYLRIYLHFHGRVQAFFITFRFRWYFVYCIGLTDVTRQKTRKTPRFDYL